MSQALQFRDVSFAYGAKPVLSEISFSLPGNGLLALVGPNGAGKSTLLRLAASLLSASAGTVEIAGSPVSAWSRKELAKTVAFVPQHLSVPFPFTVEQIVAQGRTPHKKWFGGSPEVDRLAIEQAMELAGVASLRTRTVNQISGGEQQRVKLAIALAQDPCLLLLDEPLQHLDIGSQGEFMDLLLRLHSRGLTVISAMHDLSIVYAQFPQTLLLSNGSIYALGRTENVLSNENVSAAFNLNGRNAGIRWIPSADTERRALGPGLRTEASSHD